MVVYSTNDEIADRDLTSKIHEAFDIFDILVINGEGVVAVNLDENEDIVPVNSSKVSMSQDEGNNGGLIGLIVGVIALSLGVCVSIACIHRGRQCVKTRLALERQRRTHEEDSMDDLMVGGKKDESTITSLPLSLYSADADTVSTVSTPPCSLNGDQEEGQLSPDDPVHQDLWTSEEALYWLNHPVGPNGETQHICSAATCRVCEVRRQQGIRADNSVSAAAAVQPIISITPVTNYVTRAPVNPTRRTPAYEDSFRLYMFEDTVDL
jgi:hypothetical protein